MHESGFFQEDKYLGLTVSSYSVKNETYTIELPYNAQFTPYLKLGAATVPGKTIIISTDTSDKAGCKDYYITRAGVQEYETKNWRNGDRLFFLIPEGIEILALGYRETGYPVESGEDSAFLGYFDSEISESNKTLGQFTGGRTWRENEVSAENNFYDELWKKAARTLYVTIRDTYMDCPDRERAQYMGDATNEIEESFYVFGNSMNALSANAIRTICQWQTKTTINGRTYYMMSNVRPGGNVQELGCQSLAAAVAARNYLHHILPFP